MLGTRGNIHCVRPLGRMHTIIVIIVVAAVFLLWPILTQICCEIHVLCNLNITWLMDNATRGICLSLLLIIVFLLYVLVIFTDEKVNKHRERDEPDVHPGQSR